MNIVEASLKDSEVEARYLTVPSGAWEAMRLGRRKYRRSI